MTAKGKARRIGDQAPCRVCGAKIWQHPRCSRCTRFVWCTDQDRNAAMTAHTSCTRLMEPR